MKISMIISIKLVSMDSYVVYTIFSYQINLRKSKLNFSCIKYIWKKETCLRY